MGVGSRVLVVDDDPTFLLKISKQLSKMGLHPTTTTSGTDALALLATDQFDIVLVDLCMPIMDGLTLLAKIQESNIDIISIVLSSDDSFASAVRAMKRGAFDYVVKGSNRAILQSAIARAMEYQYLRRNSREMSNAARALRKSNMEMERLVDSMSSFLIEVDTDLIVHRWNAAAEVTFGIPSGNVLNKPLENSGITWDWELVSREYEGWLTAEAPIQLSVIRYLRPDGKDGLLGATVNTIRDESQEPIGFFLMGADITDRMALEMQLLQAKKLESIGQLAAGVAHEINTPTQYVGDNIEFLKIAFDDLMNLLKAYKALMGMVECGTPRDDVALADFTRTIADVDEEFLCLQIPRAIDQSLEGVESIASIVRAMKEFSHPGVEEMESVDLNHLIQNTITVSRNEWKYVADIRTDFCPCLPAVPCLPGEFSQVILNILVNAAHAIQDAMGDGERSKGQIVISTAEGDDCVEIRIRDTGPGIPPETGERIFDPFYTTKEVGRGTGQGLAISHNVIVNKHGGSLDYETEIGQGTSFVINLPLHTPIHMGQDVVGS